MTGSPKNQSEQDRSADELGLLSLWAEDFRTFDRSLAEPGLWAVGVHRLSRRVQNSQRPLLKKLATPAVRLMSASVDLAFGIKLPPSVELGRRVRIWHNGCVLLNARRIGNDVHLRHNTTFGPARGESGDDLPDIEDGVELGAGVCVLGRVTVGAGAHVAANSVVLRNLEAGAFAMGVPARRVPR